MYQQTEMSNPGVVPSENRSSERGFTLIETAIALVVMLIVGLGAASLFFFAASNNIGANDRELSMAVAQKRMEWLRSIPLNETTRATDYAYPDGGLKETAQPVVETTTSGGRPYEVTTTIRDLDTDSENTVASNAVPATTKTITIQVKPLGAGPGWSQTTSVFGSVRLTTQRSLIMMGPHRN
jgi:prepilin-type N-terminal cleavage/methylation domain-containing protein